MCGVEYQHFGSRGLIVGGSWWLGLVMMMLYVMIL